MIIEFIILILGFIALVMGAEYLIKGAIAIAHSLGMSTLMIGLTVVAFGTSAPELFVSVGAAIRGNANVAVGNVVGSNICNILGIVGVAAIITSVKVPQYILRKDLLIMLVAMILLYLVAFDEVVTRLEGCILTVGIFCYLYFSYLSVRKQNSENLAVEQAESSIPTKEVSVTISLFLLICGLVAMLLGAHLIVDNASAIARAWGVSDLVIGISLVAIGTSLPEFATTVIAARQGEGDLAIGNAIGSNIFNVLCVLGITSVVSPLSVSIQARMQDIPFMIFACVLAWFLMKFRPLLSRYEGIALVSVYCIYVYYLFVRQSRVF